MRSVPDKVKWFGKDNRLWTILLLFTFIVGAAIRFYDLKDPPLDFHPTRQLHSAIIARGMYYQTVDGVPEWKRELAYDQWKAEGLIEPQIMERLTAWSYQAAGSDFLWLARVFAIIFWMIGSVFIFLTAKKISGISGGLMAAVYFLVWPYTAIASRAFQPESLMIMMVAIGIWAMVNWFEKQEAKWAIVAGAACGVAIYVKSTAIFFIAPTIAGLMLSNFKIKQLVKMTQVWIIFTLSILPYIIYHIWGVYFLGLLGEQFSFRFFPSLWLDPVFYLKWFNELKRVIGFEMIFGSIIGVILLPDKRFRGLFIGLFIGYILYGFTFPYHVSTHDYYHLPFAIITALGLGLVFSKIVKNAENENRKLARFVLPLILLAFIILNAWDVRVTLKRKNYQNEIVFWQNLGEEFGHDEKTIGILSDYGYRLAYWGWMDVDPWLGMDDIRLRELAGQHIDLTGNLQESLVDYSLFMVTQLDEFDQQPELQDYLYQNFEIIRADDEIIIFNLNAPSGIKD